MRQGVVTSVGVTVYRRTGTTFSRPRLGFSLPGETRSRPSDRRYFSNMSVKLGQNHFGEPGCVFALHLHVFPAAPLFSL